MVSAVVVGSGPNGLAAAITLARAGVDVTVTESAERPGGGMRSAELTVPGLVHDLCSAFHPLAQVSPFFRWLGLERHGLRWKWADIELAHPLPGGRSALLWQDIDATAAGLGADGDRWRRLLAPYVDAADEVFETVLHPLFRMPHHPLTAGRFGLRALLPATSLARNLGGESGQALFAGIAAHSFQELTQPATSAMGMALAIAGHAYGWPVAEGGTQAVCDALIAELHAWGGRVECGEHVRRLPDADVVMLDTSPTDALAIAGDRVGPWARRALRTWKYGPAAFKVDLAVDGGIPWLDSDVARAGTVHVGGTIEQIAASEAQIAAQKAGQTTPERPFVLVGQQYVADPSRSLGDTHPIWAYGHVPHGWTGNATGAILDQIERYAPGFRDRIVDISVRGPDHLEAENPNYLGGDVSVGANTLRQTVFRPRASPNPYALGKRIFLCSAATAPGAGVHGMCGFNAAQAALNSLDHAV